MQSIGVTGEATGGDSEDFEYISNAEDRLIPKVSETADIPQALIVSSTMTEKPPQRSRCRRKGVRFYVCILLTIVGICAAVLYYSPFKARETKWKGSSAISSNLRNRYNKKGSKQSGIKLDVQRLKGKDPRTLSKIPLGRISEKPGRTSNLNRNSPYGNGAQLPYEWKQRQAQSPALGGLGKLNSKSTKTSPKPLREKFPTSTPKSGFKEKSKFLQDNWQYGTDNKGKTPVKADKYGASQTTTVGFTAYPTKKQSSWFGQSKPNKDTFGQQNPPRLEGPPKTLGGQGSSRSQGQGEKKPTGDLGQSKSNFQGGRIGQAKDAGNFASLTGRGKQPVLVNEKKYFNADDKKFDNNYNKQQYDQGRKVDANQQFGQERKPPNQQYGQERKPPSQQFGQERKPPSQQFGPPVQQSGQQKTGGRQGEFGNGRSEGQSQQYGNQLYDYNGKPIYAMRDKPAPTESVGWKYQKQYAPKAGSADQFGQSQQMKPPAKAQTPRRKEQQQQFDQQMKKDQQRRHELGIQPSRKSDDRTQGDYANFYGNIGRQQPGGRAPQPPKRPTGSGSSDRQPYQSNSQNVGGADRGTKAPKRKLPPWRAEFGYRDGQSALPEAKTKQPNQRQYGDGFKSQKPPSSKQYGDEPKKYKGLTPKASGEYGNAPLSASGRPDGRDAMKPKNTDVYGKESRNHPAPPLIRPPYRAEDQYPPQRPPSSQSGQVQRSDSKIPERDRGIPLADPRAKKDNQPRVQEQYRFNKGAFDKVPLSSKSSDTDKINVGTQTGFGKLNKAISNTYGRIFNKTKSNRNAQTSKRSVTQLKYTKGQTVNGNPMNAGSNLPNKNRRYTYPFMDPRLSIDERVNDLVSRLTIPEIISQSVSAYDKVTPGIERLGIKKFNWITECLHGQANTLGTAFPQAIGLASAFSESLIYNVSEAISKEVRAEWNDLRKKNDYQINYGITCFSPTVNILRHPLWGRNQETYGEDPYMTSVFGKAYVRGMQGNNRQRMRVAAGCKHFAVHSGPETGRRSFDAKVSKEDLQMTYLPAFKACVEAGSAGLMCSYNRINGVPACANKKLLTDTARKQWGFRGYVVSDAGALDNIHLYHMYTKTPAQSVAAAASAGVNLELAMSREAEKKLQEAYRIELVTEGLLRSNIKALFRTRMQLGEFDPPEMDEYRDLSPFETVQSKAHVDLAKKAAKMSFVLLKNTGNVLPIKEQDKIKKVAIVGPYSKAQAKLYGLYAPAVNAKMVTSPYDGLSKIGEQTSQAFGCLKPDCKVINEGDIKVAVTDADVTFVCLGTGSEREKGDRESLSLPGRQMELLKQAANHAKGKPVILLLFNGSPVDLKPALTDSRVSAILECWFPAQAAGAALYDTIRGIDADSVPSARLPMTWPDGLSQVPDISDYSMDGRTYRYSNLQPLFPFGYGLSYTKFQYLGARVSPRIGGSGDTVKVTVNLKNIGRYDAYEVVQLYMSVDPNERKKHAHAPIRQLVGFKRVRVNQNQVVNVIFEISPQQRTIFSAKNGQDKWVPLHGKFEVFAGGQQPKQKRALPSNVVQTEFEISAFNSKRLTS